MQNCKHFGICGGCSLYQLPYQEQLRLKQKMIKEILGRFNLNIKILPMNFYNQYFYRNKMEFTFSEDKEPICGLYQLSDFKIKKVIGIEECLIFSENIFQILEAVKNFMRTKKYKVYNKYTHKGFLRNLIVKESKFIDQIMIGIVTTSQDFLNKEEFVKFLLKIEFSKKIESIYWIINDSISDAVIFQKKELLYGKPYIYEKLDEFTFKIGIDTFFQVNPFLARKLYNNIKNYADLNKFDKALDLYCGVGCIGMYLAKSAGFVCGIELNKNAVELAKEIARLNKIENILFVNSDIKKFLNTEGINYKSINTFIVNPPRQGLSGKIKRAILRLSPKYIFYSSCNLQNLAKDLKDLTEGYCVEFIEPFDFFPNTLHLECLAKLIKN
ncbi:MAG: 23S rRNA (uracil(1939)-C(5))-methyltransferase RlmD [Candidatus Omnitrophica bacterium]|nr:23S rRNA (uracil(1939)-C(5))-methyltransferase RlmD [Candidatus Omnitrophota bacterium]